jgi:YVTN family beta-propeller protein
LRTGVFSGLLGFLLASCGATAAWAGSSNSLIDISADGRWLACANHDNGTVSIIDLAAGKKIHEVPVGKKPEGVTFLGSTAQVAATIYAEDKVVLIDAAAGKALGEIDVFDEPYGIISNAEGTKLYVTLEYPGKVVEIDPASRAVTREFDAGAFPRGIALSAAEQRLYVTEYFTGSALALSLADGRIVDRWNGSSSDNLARQIALHPTRPKGYVPHIRSRVNINQGEGSVVPFVTVVDTAAGEGRRRNTVPMDSFFSTFVVANPWETAVSPDGKLFCAVFAGTDDMYVCDCIDDNYREIGFKKVLRLGKNPRAVRFAPDGKTFYVYNTLDFNIVGFDSDTLQKTATISVCENPLSPEVLQGKILFYSALQPIVGRRWISCSSCHPDGDGDGRTWQNPEGLRNTTALYGMAWTHPIHWSATRLISSRPNTPTIWSISGNSSKSAEPSRCGKQPATITPLVLPARFRSSISRITALDSARELSMNPHVLTMTKSAPSGSETRAYPSSASVPNIRSLSTRFLAQPRLTKAYVPFERPRSTSA